MDKIKLAWAAGFFDGEGCTLLHKDRRWNGKGQLMLMINQLAVNRTVLYKFKNIVGVGDIYGPYKNGQGYICRYAVQNFQGFQHVVCLIWSELSDVKKAQIRKALTRYHSNG
jgi:hypothetical protein